jgi:hypothetical protein
MYFQYWMRNLILKPDEIIHPPGPAVHVDDSKLPVQDADRVRQAVPGVGHEPEHPLACYFFDNGYNTSFRFSV